MKRRFTYGSKTGRFLLSLVFALLMMPFMAFEQENTKVTLNFKNIVITKVFQEIETQSGFTFFFAAGTLDAKSLVSIQVTKTPLEKVLTELLKPFNVDYQFKNKSIILKKSGQFATNEETVSSNDTIPSITVNGKVLDSKGLPLLGVTVSVKGKRINSITDENGDFKITSTKENSILVFSSVGFETQEVKVKKNTIISISLKERVLDLQKVEVVSTGYQEIPKDRATGSFSHIDNSTFNRRTGSSILDRIDGLVPGLYMSPSTKPDPLDRITIRGISTFNASKRPLIVVDNFIFDDDINQINPNDVESITVLKDAAAASIWGVRAGNGVIVITLKKGRPNNPLSVTLNTQVGAMEKPRFKNIPTIPSSEIIAIERERFKSGYYDFQLNDNILFPSIPLAVEILNQNKQGLISENKMNNLLNNLASNDVKKEIYNHLLQTQITQQYALNISGGTDTHQYYSSVGYDKTRPNEINSKSQRISMRFRNTWRPIKNLSLNAEINYTQSQLQSNNEIGKNFQSITSSPYLKLVDQNNNPLAIPYQYRKSYIDTLQFPGKLNWEYFPLDEANFGNITSKEYTTRINGEIRYAFMRAFKITVQYQWQKTTNSYQKISSEKIFLTRNEINKFATTDPTNGLPIYPIPRGSQYSSANGELTSWNIRSQLDFNKSLSQHNISALIGLETRQTESQSITPPGQFGFQEESALFNPTIYGSHIVRPGEYFAEIQPGSLFKGGTLNRFGSYYANAAYNYDQRYTFTISGRVDQSNFFGVKSNDRLVPLWSTGASWEISNEPFYKINWMDKLKFTATYGYSGNVNAGISPFATATYQIPKPPIYLPYAQITSPPNPHLKWERVSQYNFSLLFSLKNNRLQGLIEVYKKTGKDLIGSIQSNPSSGFTVYTGNTSRLSTKGIDLSLTNNNKIGNFALQHILILGYNTNKVLAYYTPQLYSYATPSDYNSMPIIGFPVDKLFSYKWAGLSDIDGSSQIYINDKVASGSNYEQVQLSDLKYNGRRTPAYFGSIRNNLTWKNIDISIGISGKFNYAFVRPTFEGSLGYPGLQHIDYLKTWKKPGDERITNVPRFDDNNPNPYDFATYLSSDNIIEKGDHIRLQDIKLTYSFRPVAARNIFKSCSLNFFIDNVGIIWRKSKYIADIENQLTFDPNQRIYTIGLKFDFL
ncbi:SusC/RagA family TonB-linked outer membrane protein [Chitinophaga sp. NPDC101104]|uniref:SusC/RagA family TonB-linked outer membrane protein n=1 Tax=Chitinophaga sp. NPDC101104 TaxID=3390561 RepID=UPI003D043C05